MLDYNNDKTIAAVKVMARNAHATVNQTYNGEPYFDAHVIEVYKWALLNILLIPEEMRVPVLCAALLHDVLEDCPTVYTYNDLVKALTKEFDGNMAQAEIVADIVFAVTNNTGKTRKERANDDYYNKIVTTPYADFVKICDRLANASASVSSEHGMSNAYVKEYKLFKKKLYYHFKYALMWYQLDKMLLRAADRLKVGVGSLVKYNKMFPGYAQTYVVEEIMLEQGDDMIKCYVKMRDLQSENFEDDKYQWATIDQITKV